MQPGLTDSMPMHFRCAALPELCRSLNTCGFDPMLPCSNYPDATTAAINAQFVTGYLEYSPTGSFDLLASCPQACHMPTCMDPCEADGIPQTCTLQCAAVFLPFYDDCRLMLEMAYYTSNSSIGDQTMDSFNHLANSCLSIEQPLLVEEITRLKGLGCTVQDDGVRALNPMDGLIPVTIKAFTECAQTPGVLSLSCSVTKICIKPAMPCR